MKRSASLMSLLLTSLFMLEMPLAVWADPLTLHEGTPVRLKVLQTISSKSNNQGDMIDFEVVEDVLAEDGKTVLIKSGTAARGVVSQVEERGRMGKAGELNIQVDSTKAVDGTKVPLRAGLNRDGKDATGSVIALSLIISPLFLLKRGKDASIPVGTEVRSFVNNDIRIKMESLANTSTGEKAASDDNASEQADQKYAETKQAEASSNKPDSFAQLEALGKLRKQGVITEAEFQAKKKQLLGL